MSRIKSAAKCSLLQPSLKQVQTRFLLMFRSTALLPDVMGTDRLTTCDSYTLVIFFFFFFFYICKLMGHYRRPEVNYVINYSPSCCSKPVRPPFIFGTHIKYIQTARILKLHDQGPETYPCDIRGSNVILPSYENTFCVQKINKIN